MRRQERVSLGKGLTMIALKADCSGCKGDSRYDSAGRTKQGYISGVNDGGVSIPQSWLAAYNILNSRRAGEPWQ